MTSLAQIRRALQRKIEALRKLGEHLGMWGEFRRPPTKRDPALAMAALLRVMDDTALPEQRYAAALILDYYVPEWREIVPPTILGPVVDRDSPEVARWRRIVLKRDGYRCVLCGSTEQLHVHHIAPWAEVPWLRIVPENGITLCVDCHADMHLDRGDLVRSAGRRRGGGHG